MDFVPFTLFFMVSLLSFQGNVLGKPATEADYSIEQWAQKCKKELDDKNYCTEKLTGHGYPSAEELKQLYHDNIGRFDIRFPKNETVDRDGLSGVCRYVTNVVSNITMIRDEHDNFHYTLYIPGVYEVSITFTECQKNANINPRIKAFEKNNIQCVQKSYQYPFFVLSRDKQSLEWVNIKGLHSSCDLVQNYKKN